MPRLRTHGARRDAVTEIPSPPFAIIEPTTARGPIVAHVPHASTVIPPDIRAEILLDDALARELIRLTDWHTDELFAFMADLGAPLFVNCLSRLVFDPERFVDDADEPMAAVGQGVVYTRTTDGEPLRAIDDAERTRRIEAYFDPYHAAFTALVADTLDRFGRCLIVDCHSFATEPLPSEPDQAPHRPDICIGTDAFHTPPELAEALHGAMASEGLRVRLDSPFAGSLVPLSYNGRDDRVRSVMIEVRRGLYCDETTGARSASFGDIRASLARAIQAVV